MSIFRFPGFPLEKFKRHKYMNHLLRQGKAQQRNHNENGRNNQKNRQGGFRLRKYRLHILKQLEQLLVLRKVLCGKLPREVIVASKPKLD